MASTTGTNVLQAIQVFTGTGTGTSADFDVDVGIYLRGKFNWTLYGGGTATVKLEKSYDGGTSGVDVSKDVFGNPASVTLAGGSITLRGEEPENGVSYRANCTAYTSSVTSRLSK